MSTPFFLVRIRNAFTLIELLMVVTLISVLLALGLPAIQAAREAARQTECKNNIKQLALAAISHHDTHGHFPTGGWGWFWVGDPDRGYGKQQPGGWIYNLLPYCDEAPLHDLPSDGLPEVLTRSQRVAASRVIQSPLSIVNCPSRRATKIYPLTANEGGGLGFYNSITPNAAGRSDYAINAGHVYCEWTNTELGRGPTSYADAVLWTSNRTWGSDQPRYLLTPNGSAALTGVSFERSEVSIRQVTDGLSNTYLIGERYVAQADYETGLNFGDNETWCTGFNNDNYRATGHLKGNEIVELTPIRDSQAEVTDSFYRFGSAHPNGWNVAFCDGSVLTVSYEIDWQIHRDLGNRMDGNVTNYHVP